MCWNGREERINKGTSLRSTLNVEVEPGIRRSPQEGHYCCYCLQVLPPRRNAPEERTLANNRKRKLPGTGLLGHPSEDKILQKPITSQIFRMELWMVGVKV